MDIQIRRATYYDLEQIDNIEKTLNHRILSYDLLSSTLGKNNYYYFIAVKNNTVIGYIAAELLVDHFDILAVAVLDKYRRQNIATRLIQAFYNTCQAINVLDIFLEVRCNNNSAICFYEKLGFEKISERKNYYTDTKENAYIYKKMV